MTSHNRYWNIFEKPGSLSTALRDFRSVNPTNIKRIKLDASNVSCFVLQCKKSIMTRNQYMLRHSNVIIVIMSVLSLEQQILLKTRTPRRSISHLFLAKSFSRDLTISYLDLSHLTL